MTEVPFANAKVNATETMIFVIDTIAIVTNANAFVTNTIAFVIFAIVKITIPIGEKDRHHCFDDNDPFSRDGNNGLHPGHHFLHQGENGRRGVSRGF
jgi:hypothetical protein